MGRQRQPLGPCNCSGARTRTYDFDIDTVSTADAKLIREISRGQTSPWFFTTLQAGPETITAKYCTTPVKCVWRVIEVAWEATATETDICTSTAWEGGPSLGMEGFGSPYCVWQEASIHLSGIRIKGKKEVEIEFSGTMVRTVLERQTTVSIGAGLNAGTVVGIPAIGVSTGIQYDPVTMSDTTAFTTPNNTPQPVLDELHK